MTKINCILLVDDDETSNFLNELLIQQLNVTDTVLVAKNGVEALSLLHRRELFTGPDTLVLLDIKMPVMNGFEFLEAFADLNIPQKNAIRIVMLTTSLNPKDMEQLKRFNVAGVITKPLTAQNCNDVINRYFKAGTGMQQA